MSALNPRTALFLVGVAALLGSCDQQAAADPRAGIGKTRNAYAAAWQAGDAQAVAALYAEDAVVLYPNQPPVVGRAAIADYFTGFFAEFPHNEFELESAEIEIAGDWAWDRGSYHWKGRPVAGGEPVIDEGKYLVILRRVAGEWKVSRDMDNSNLAHAQTTRESPGAVAQ